MRRSGDISAPSGMVWCSAAGLGAYPALAAGRTSSWDGVPPENDLLSITAGTIENPDIVWSKMIPVVGEEIALSARVRGRGAKEPVAVHFSLKAPDVPEVILEAKPSAEQDGADCMDYEAQWQPEETGWYTFTVDVDPENMAGDPFRANNVAQVTIPVTWTELHIFPWYSPERCRWVTAANVRHSDPEEGVAYWRRRGIRPLGYMRAIQSELDHKSAEELTEYMLGGAKRFSDAGFDGYLVDELGSYPSEEGLAYIRRYTAAFAAVKKAYPNLQAYTWTGGGLLREEVEMARSLGHILMTEAYPDYIAQAFGTHSFEKHLEHRIQMARNTDALFTPRTSFVAAGGDVASTIVALGIGAECGVTWRPHVENWVRVCRRLAPEAPGICYYPGGQWEEWNDPEGDCQEFIDYLTVEYFLQPVLMIKETDIFLDNYHPTVGATVNLIVRIRNIGGMKATNVGVDVFARHLASGVRTLIHQTTLREIGNGILRTNEDDPPSSCGTREIDGILYPDTFSGGTTTVYVDRALVRAPWTPTQAGYHTLEVELHPSDQYTILNGVARMEAAVGR